MNEMFLEYRKRSRIFLFDYGKLSFAFLLCVGIIVLVASLVSLTAPQKLKVSFLDVGQGDSILIQTPNGHDMLIDGGPNNLVLEKLGEKMNYFDRHLDVVVSTHPDADHITGLIPVLEKFKVDHIIMSPVSGHTGVFEVLQKSVDDEHAVLHVGKRGDEIIFGDGVVARILYPASNFHGNEKDTNDASVSMVITYGDESVLLTGDLPSAHEGELLDGLLHLLPSHERGGSHVTIYKAGHHGSKYSSGQQLLSYIRPEYAVISAGKDNKYNHPNPEAVTRLQTYAQEILSTIQKGTITFFLDGKTVEIKTSH